MRTNRAIARFWEGTGLLHQMRAEWFDSVSCCITFSRAALDAKQDEVHHFRHTLVRLMSLCHGAALEEIGGAVGHEALKTIDPFGLDDHTLLYLKNAKDVHLFNRVEVLLHLIQSLITKSHDDGILKVPPPILSRVYQTLSRGFVNQLNAKKITDTKFPWPYAQVISLLLLVNLLLIPCGVAVSVQSKWWAPVFTFFPVISMFGLNFIAGQLENPFGRDHNDLPISTFQKEMNRSLMMLLQHDADHIAGLNEYRCKTEYNALVRSMEYGKTGCKSQIERITYFGGKEHDDTDTLFNLTLGPKSSIGSMCGITSNSSSLGPRVSERRRRSRTNSFESVLYVDDQLDERPRRSLFLQSVGSRGGEVTDDVPHPENSCCKEADSETKEVVSSISNTEDAVPEEATPIQPSSRSNEDFDENIAYERFGPISRSLTSGQLEVSFNVSC